MPLKRADLIASDSQERGRRRGRGRDQRADLIASDSQERGIGRGREGGREREC